MLRRTFVWKISTCFAVALAFSSCTRKNPNDIGLGYYGPKTPYESPFLEKKLLLSETNSSNLDESKTSEFLVAVIDNSCSDTTCSSDKASLRRLSCQLSTSLERNKNLQEQAYTFSISKNMDHASLEQQIEQDSCVIGVSEEQKYQSTAVTNDPLLTQQNAYLDTVKWTLGFSRLSASKVDLKPVKVAVIDSGVGAHPDLDGIVIERIDLRSVQSKASTTSCPNPLNSLEEPLNTHGTFVAGIIGAKSGNNQGVAGVSPNAQIISIMIGNCKGEMSTAEVANAMGMAFSRGAEVINLSLGGAAEPDPVFLNNLTQILNKKGVVVVAAGNESKFLSNNSETSATNGVKSYPASYASSYPGVISVAWGKQDGTLQQGNKTTWGSNYGKDIIKILAPGDSIISSMNPAMAPGYTDVSAGYAKGSGSSFATPIVTGAVAITLGLLKQYNLDFDERMVEDLVLKSAASKTDLQEFVQGGRLLDFDRLVETLLKLTATPVELPLTVSSKNMRYNSTDKASEVSFNVSWNVPFPHYGARLGIFDLSQECNFSEPCRVQDFELGDLVGSRTINLTRNHTLPMVSDLQDPNFSLNVVAAVYYKVPDPDRPGKFKNIFGVDAKTTVNLRDFEIVSWDSPLIGEIMQMRTDQNRLFINGWVCLQNSNKALKVELQDESGQPIPTDTAYRWRYQAPVSRGCGNLTLDSGYSGCSLGNGDRGEFPYVSGTIHQKNLSSFPAGMESTPLLMVDDPPDRKRPGCRTSTANHGFEFIVPFDTLIAKNLVGKKLRVKAYHPSQSRTLWVPTEYNQTEITVPDIQVSRAGTQSPTRAVLSAVQLTRQADTIQFSGDICTKSPSPVIVEVSYSSWGLHCRLRDETGFPLKNLTSKDPLVRNCTLRSGGWPMVYDPSVDANQETVLVFEDLQSGNALFQTFNWRTAWDVSFSKLWETFLKTFPGPRLPNTVLTAPTQPQIDTPFNLAVKNRQLLDVSSGKKIESVLFGRFSFSEAGAATTEQKSEHESSRTTSGLRNMGVWSDQGSSWLPRSGYVDLWDWYDVGEFYTPGSVAYEFDEATETGRYLKQELLISKAMRETKKFETPLPAGYRVLGSTQISEFSKQTDCYRFPISYTINHLKASAISVSGEFEKVMLEGEVPPVPIFKVSSDDAMTTLPVELRFFQDGVLIEHLLSDFGSKTYKNTYFNSYE